MDEYYDLVDEAHYRAELKTRVNWENKGPKKWLVVRSSESLDFFTVYANNSEEADQLVQGGMGTLVDYAEEHTYTKSVTEHEEN